MVNIQTEAASVNKAPVILVDDYPWSLIMTDPSPELIP